VAAVWGEDDGTTGKIISNRSLKSMRGATAVTRASSSNQAVFTQWRAAMDGSGTVTIARDRQTNPAPPPFTLTVNIDRLQ